MTVAVMEPEKVLALSVPPLPEKLLLDEAPMSSLPSPARVWLGKAVMAESIDEARLTVEVDFWLAVTFSTI